MSRFDKLKDKLLNKQSTFTFRELSYLLKKLGYKEKKTGKTSGSRVAFVNEENGHILRLHKPHPSDELKEYLKKEIVKELRDKQLI